MPPRRLGARPLPGQERPRASSTATLRLGTATQGEGGLDARPVHRGRPSSARRTREPPIGAAGRSQRTSTISRAAERPLPVMISRSFAAGDTFVTSPPQRGHLRGSAGRVLCLPPRDRPLERRHRGRGGPLVCRRGALLRGRSWELSAYVPSGGDASRGWFGPRAEGHISRAEPAMRACRAVQVRDDDAEDARAVEAKCQTGSPG